MSPRSGFVQQAHAPDPKQTRVSILDIGNLTVTALATLIVNLLGNR